MKKIILIGFTIFLNLYGAENSLFNKNMDKKIYYDADRTQNESYAQQAKVLEKFITSKVDQATYEAYKNGKVKMSQEELEIAAANNQQIAGGTAAQQAGQNKGFFASMMDKIGLGSKTNTQTNTQTNTAPADEEPGFFAKMLEKIGIGSTKKLPQNDTEVTQEATQEVTQEATQEVTQEVTNEK